MLMTTNCHENRGSFSECAPSSGAATQPVEQDPPLSRLSPRTDTAAAGDGPHSAAHPPADCRQLLRSAHSPGRSNLARTEMRNPTSNRTTLFSSCSLRLCVRTSVSTGPAHSENVRNLRNLRNVTGFLTFLTPKSSKNARFLTFLSKSQNQPSQHWDPRDPREFREFPQIDFDIGGDFCMLVSSQNRVAPQNSCI